MSDEKIEDFKSTLKGQICLKKVSELERVLSIQVGVNEKLKQAKEGKKKNE